MKFDKKTFCRKSLSVLVLVCFLSAMFGFDYAPHLNFFIYKKTENYKPNDLSVNTVSIFQYLEDAPAKKESSKKILELTSLLRDSFIALDYKLKDVKEFFSSMSENISKYDPSIAVEVRDGKIVFKKNNQELKKFTLVEFTRRKVIEQRLIERIKQLRKEDGFSDSLKHIFISEIKNMSKSRILDLYDELNVDELVDINFEDKKDLEEHNTKNNENEDKFVEAKNDNANNAIDDEADVILEKNYNVTANSVDDFLANVQQAPENYKYSESDYKDVIQDLEKVFFGYTIYCEQLVLKQSHLERTEEVYLKVYREGALKVSEKMLNYLVMQSKIMDKYSFMTLLNDIKDAKEKGESLSKKHEESFMDKFATMQDFLSPENETPNTSQSKAPIPPRTKETKKRLLARLHADQKENGAGNFKDEYFISDIHGAADKLIIIIIDILGFNDLDRVKKFKKDVEEKKKKEKPEVLSDKLAKIVIDALNDNGITLLILFKEKFEKMLDRKVNYDEVQKLIDKYYKDIAIHFLGDIGDRGPNALRASHILEEIKNFYVLSIFIIGNHDLCYVDSINGSHFPQEGFNYYEDRISKIRLRKNFTTEFGEQAFNFLIDRKIVKEDTRDNGMYELVVKDEMHLDSLLKDAGLKKNGTNELIKGADILKFFAIFSKQEKEQILKYGGADFSARKRYWMHKFYEFNEKAGSMQKAENLNYIKITSKDKCSYNDVVLRIEKLYEKINKGFNNEERKLWNDLRGNSFNIEVYTGFRAVGKMSLEWWEDRKMQLDEFIEKYKDSEEWKELKMYVDDVVLLLDKEYKDKTDKHKNKLEDVLVYRALQAIHRWNYYSREWLSSDWVSHPGWGPSFFAEKTTDKYEVNGNSYLEDKSFHSMANFIRRNFALFGFTEMGDLLMHGFIPIITDKQNPDYGKMVLIYKNKKYVGEDVFGCMFAIESDYRVASIDNEYGSSKCKEGSELITSWYADATTKLKAEHMKQYSKLKIDGKQLQGFELFADDLDIVGHIFMGHNPYGERFYDKTKSGKEQEFPIIGKKLVFCDDGLSPGYFYSGGARARILSRSKIKFDRDFGVNVRKKLVENEIIQIKRGVTGEDYVVLKNNSLEDIKRIIKENKIDVKTEDVLNWFKQIEGLHVIGFETRESTDVKRNPDLSLVDKKGIKKIEHPIPTKDFAIDRTKYLNNLEVSLRGNLARRYQDTVNIHQDLIEILGEKYLESNVELKSGKSVTMKQAIEDKIKFGTSGWREEIGKGFNPLFASIVFYGIGQALKKDSSRPEDAYFLLSYDTRESGYEIAVLGARILSSMGIKVLIQKKDNEYLTTPQMSKILNSGQIIIDGKTYKICQGASVTASHNNQKDNGIKVFGKEGGPASDEFIDLAGKEIKNFTEKIENKTGFGYVNSYETFKLKGLVKEFDSIIVLKSYSDYVSQKSAQNKKNEQEIYFDVMHGASVSIVKKYLENKKIENVDEYILHGNSKMPVSYDPNPSKLNTGPARLWSIKDAAVLKFRNIRLPLAYLTEEQIDDLMNGKSVNIYGVDISFNTNNSQDASKTIANNKLDELVNSKKANIMIDKKQENIELELDIKTVKTVIVMDTDADRMCIIQGGNYINANMMIPILSCLMIEKLVEEFKNSKDSSIKMTSFKRKYQHLFNSSGDQLKLRFVRTNATTHLLDKIIEKYNADERLKELFFEKGIKLNFEVIETEVGVKHFMKDIKTSMLCGESSGHIAINSESYDDGFLIGILFVNLLKEKGVKDIMQYYKSLERTFGFTSCFIERSVNVNNNISFGEVCEEMFKQMLKGKNLQLCSSVKNSFANSVRFQFTNGSWLSIRKSGTEELVRIYAEAQTDEEVESLYKLGYDLVKKLDTYDNKKALEKAVTNFLKHENILNFIKQIIGKALNIKTTGDDQAFAKQIDKMLELLNINILKLKDMLLKFYKNDFEMDIEKLNPEKYIYFLRAV
jgi:phosphomannomutase